MEEDVRAARDSFSRALKDETFFRRFYDELMASSDEIRAKFETTDFERQFKVLEDSLYLMLSAAGTTKGLAYKELSKLSKRHSRGELDIKPPWYEHWMSALMTALSRSDPSFSPELEKAWRAALEPGIELLKSKY